MIEIKIKDEPTTPEGVVYVFTYQTLWGERGVRENYHFYFINEPSMYECIDALSEKGIWVTPEELSKYGGARLLKVKNGDNVKFSTIHGM